MKNEPGMERTPFERSLLQAARREAPRSGDRERALERALGSRPPRPSKGNAPSSSAPRTTRTLLFGGVAVVGLAALLLLAKAAQTSEPVLADVPRPVPSAQRAAPRTLELLGTSFEHPSSGASTPTSSATAAGPPSAAVPHAASRADDADELELVSKAKSQLSGADPAAAVATLNRYAARFPNGALSEEAGALRVEALVAHHDTAAARAAGARYLATHPDGVYAARVTALLATLP